MIFHVGGANNRERFHPGDDECNAVTSFCRMYACGWKWTCSTTVWLPFIQADAVLRR
ncbi:MAG: hypothetical protein GPOALKHO_001208 [Sodalis sp.]|nr:MAG: hypothetical protein GPOALKHO_001208 [Sodalis sp.]